MASPSSKKTAPSPDWRLRVSDIFTVASEPSRFATLQILLDPHPGQPCPQLLLCLLCGASFLCISLEPAWLCNQAWASPPDSGLARTLARFRAHSVALLPSAAWPRPTLQASLVIQRSQFCGDHWCSPPNTPPPGETAGVCCGGRLSRPSR